MQKKVMAVAVAGALGALAVPATSWAQASTVQIGGSIHLIYILGSRSGNTEVQPLTGQRISGSHDNLHTSEPEIFVRGEENIGGANAVWFQCTSTFDVVGAGPAVGAGDGWCGRNSGIGFKGNWGNVFFGNWDNPSKLFVTPLRGWWGLNNAFAGAGRMLWSNPASDTFNSGASFHRRQARSVNYHSPSWGGFAFRAAYSATNEATALAVAAGFPGKPRMFSADATYTNGPIYVGLAYERHKNYNPSGVAALSSAALAYGPGRTDENWTIGGMYTFGGFVRVAGLWTRTEYETTNTTNLKKSGWWAIVDWTIAGPHSLKANYAKVGNSKGNSLVAAGAHPAPSLVGLGTGAKLWGVNYAYEFSKRTTGYVGYNRIKPDSGAGYSLGMQAGSTGQSQRVYGLGMRHRF